MFNIVSEIAFRRKVYAQTAYDLLYLYEKLTTPVILRHWIAGVVYMSLVEIITISVN